MGIVYKCISNFHNMIFKRTIDLPISENYSVKEVSGDTDLYICIHVFPLEEIWLVE